MKLTDFQTKFTWGIGILIILLVWMIFPLIFKQLISVYDLPENLKEFGAFGDIYGSLNTLISSIALCAVAFSTWLQVTSLKETREANERQLKLAQAVHDEQIKESRNAVFSNAFYSLLNYKNDVLNSLRLKQADGREIVGNEIFDSLNTFFVFHEEVLNETTDLNILRTQYHQKIIDLNGGKAHLGIYSYFQIYKNIYYLIENSQLTITEKEMYMNFFNNTVQTPEQMFLFFLCPMHPEYLELLRDKGLFRSFRPNNLYSYIDQFYDESYFS